MIGVLTGILLWTLVEYLLHRFVFHRFAVPFRSTHPKHHVAPRDIRFLFAQPVLVAIGSAALILIVWLLTGSWVQTFQVIGGLWAGYLYYESVHYRIHFADSQGWLLRRQRHNHFQHHFVTPKSRFGVTTPLWDWVFRTTA